MIAGLRPDFERAQPVVDFSGRNLGDHLAVELLREITETTAERAQLPFPNAIGLFGLEHFFHELLRAARFLARFQVRDVMLNGVPNCFPEGPQLLRRFLRHHAQWRWELGVLDTILP